MNKPQKPKKKIEINGSASFNFDRTPKKVSLEDFLAWLKETIPRNAKDVTLELTEDIDYDWNGNIVSSWSYLEIGWKTKVNNPNYELELKKYQKKLEKWNKQCKS